MRRWMIPLLCLVSACGGTDKAFANRAWAASCTASPLSMLVTFPGDEVVDEAGSERSYLAHVDVTVDSTGLEDVYAWQVLVDDAGGAETEWLERAPIPDDLVDAYDLQPLGIEALTFDRGESSATITGDCTWGDVAGDLTMDTSWCNSLCFDCNTGGDPRQIGSALALVAAALVIRGRRAGAGATSPQDRAADRPA